jgi:hypothetical protein
MGTLKIGSDKFVWARDRPVYMALGGKMHDGVSAIVGHDTRHELSVTNIPLDKFNAATAF